MANDITITPVVNGSKIVVLEVQIFGDGSGDESDTVIADFSTLAAGEDVTEFAIRKFAANLSGFSAVLNWDADTNLQALTLTEGSSGFDIQALFGGQLNDRTTTGKTGDLLISTYGLGASDAGTILLELGKK